MLHGKQGKDCYFNLDFFRIANYLKIEISDDNQSCNYHKKAKKIKKPIQESNKRTNTSHDAAHTIPPPIDTSNHNTSVAGGSVAYEDAILFRYLPAE